MIQRSSRCADRFHLRTRLVAPTFTILPDKSDWALLRCSAARLQVMGADIIQAADRSVDGIVTGALAAHGSINLAGLRHLQTQTKEVVMASSC